LQLAIADDHCFCDVCPHKLRSVHTRYFAVHSQMLVVSFSPRIIYRICPNLLLNNPPVEEPANSALLSRFVNRAMACLDDFHTFAILRDQVEDFRSEIIAALQRRNLSASDLSRARFRLLHQARIWNQVCKEALAGPPVSMASLDGDSVAVIIALALYSDKHRDLVKGLDENRPGCIDMLMTESDPIQVTIGEEISCVVYFPKQSAALRRLTIGKDSFDEEFIRSLSEAGEWMASGGKSDATFNKSNDNRLVIKVVKKKDVNMLKQMGADYFRHLGEAFRANSTSMLVPILGAYRVTIAGVQKHLIVTPNLFYGMEQVEKVFDLKGTCRIHRPVDFADDENAATRETATLLDGNLLSYTRGIPLSLSSASAALLQQTLQNDTTFLASKSIVDYSVLIGLDSRNEQIAIAIIDYLRIYSLDAMLETQVKSLGMLAGRPSPTVIPPQDYRVRFCRALNTYFALPDP